MTELQLIEGDVLLRDAAGNPVAVKVDGTYYQLAVSDDTTHGLLGQILSELKKANLHWEIVNGDSQVTDQLWTHYYSPSKIGTDTIWHSPQHASVLVLPVTEGA